MSIILIEADFVNEENDKNKNKHKAYKVNTSQAHRNDAYLNQINRDTQKHTVGDGQDKLCAKKDGAFKLPCQKDCWKLALFTH